MGNVEVRKNEEGYELNLNALIYSELLMSNVRLHSFPTRRSSDLNRKSVV